ncbi:MAG TPA: OmpA family protein [candidate division Zixibacteria bacterium]
MKRLTLLLVALLVVWMAVSANAIDLTGKFGLSVHPAMFKPILADHSDAWAVGPEGSVILKYGFTPNVAVGVMGTYSFTKEADLTGKTDGAGFTFSTDPNGYKFNAMMVEAVAFYHFMPEEKFNPYVFGGAGIAFWNWKDKDGNAVLWPDTSELDSFEVKDQELTAVFGVGLDYYVTENIALNIGGKAHYLTHVLTSLKNEKDPEEVGLDLPKLIPEAYVGATFYFGKPKDSDKDAVPDKVDQCPDTPLGAMVDENGCPLDADNDGVYDGLDKCPNTPKGAKIDVNGCPIDSDGDGVFDGIDQCASTPKGVKVDAKGCPMDSDGDGVADYLDKCPNTPKGAKIDVNGCPIDSDADGAFDGIDQCPNTPAGVAVDEKGCPKVAAIEKITLHIKYASGSANLDAPAMTALDDLAQRLSFYKDVKIEVLGYTDATGTLAANMRISKLRADGVKNYLVKKEVDAARIEAKGMGPENPIASNDTPEGKQENRRIEIVPVK